jgi:hypothetical protein
MEEVEPKALVEEAGAEALVVLVLLGKALFLG